QRIAGAVEADHETVADQLVLPHALDIGEVLDARRGVCRQRAKRQRDECDGRPDQCCLPDAGHPTTPLEFPWTARHSHDAPSAIIHATAVPRAMAESID